ncbi:MAG: polysaccharide lyase 8 family protein [Verrucomicrobia bacterium]|nr:polysaccharide lyase 8 family protein [Verrucomicrobiota bacterium]
MHAFVVVIFALTVLSARADEFDTLRQKWSDMLTGGASLRLTDTQTASAITSITNTANSNWNSLNKSATRTSLWSDAASTTDSSHLSTNFSRLRAMALAYATTGSTLRGNTALRDDILGGLDWMYANRYNETKRIYDNWWDWEIGSPKLFVDAVTLLYADLSPTQLANYLRAVEKFVPSATTQAPGGSTGTFTGANRMDKIYVVAIRGLLAKDDAKLRAARDAFSNLFLYVTSGDGFYVDGSFIQHNRHPYTGSYGAALMSAIAPILALINGPNADSPTGSTWRVTDQNLGNIFRWIYEAYEPVIYRGGMMAMLQGRAISRNGTSEHGLGHGLMLNFLRLSELAPEADRTRLRALLRGWAESDTSRSFVASAPLPQIADAQQLLADPAVTPRAELRGNVMYGSMDRMVHLGPGFAAGLALSSSRIYTYESINTENLRGWYTGDGLLYLYNNDLAHFSDAYWPTVNPRRLPGTTVDATQSRANASGQSTNPTYNWVGGVSLGRYGAAGMQLDGWSNTLTAKKSWFMFEHEIACLGAGITSTDNRPIETTVENRLLNNTTAAGAFTVDDTPQPTTLGWSAALDGARWAHLAGRTTAADIGYYFPGGATVKALREARTGAWSDINGGGPTTAITRNYLTLWLEHGANPTNATYAYYLLPNRSAAEVADFATTPTVILLENSPAIQAVRHTTLGITAANFWNDGRATIGGLTVDKKASVVVQDEGAGELTLALADPTQANPGSIIVELDTAATSALQADPGITVVQLAPTLRLSVNVAGARGKSFRARFATAPTKTTATLTNLSTRAYLAARDDTIIAGFVVGGTGTKRLLVRAIGPTLATFGLTGALANPRLAIVNQAGATVAENDDWGSAPGTAAELAAIFPVAGAFALSATSRDAAAVVSLPPGQYSAVVRSMDGTSGVALVELYDLAPDAPARLVNLSTRTFSGTGEQTAIVGFGLGGTGAQPVLVRAAGPALTAFGVTGALTDPQLRVVNSAGVTLAQNDNWGASVFAPEITAAATSVAAFALAPTSRDAAALPMLTPGTYTAIASGAGTTTGQTLVEVYIVP